MQTPIMSPNQMVEVIKSVKPGDQLRINFTDKTFNGDLKGRVYHILMMCAPVGNQIRLGDMQMWNLKAVADSGRWDGFGSNYTALVLDGFDAKHFIHRTVDHEMLKSIGRV